MEHECKKRFWSVEEDTILADYINKHGTGKWNRIPKVTGLKRSGKSCRLRWMNYLSPEVKRGEFSEEEQDLVIRLHNLLGNRWSLIAGRIRGRTDNQVKNFWNAHLSKKLGVVNKNKRSKVCVPPESIPIPVVEPKDNCNSTLKGNEHSSQYIDEGEKLTHESLGLDLIDFASSIHEGIIADDFGCNFSYGNSVFDLCTPPPYLTESWPWI